MSLAGVLLALAAPAAAQLPYAPSFTAGERTYALHLGVAQPTGSKELDAFSSRGPSLGVEHLRYLSDWVAWGLGLDLHQLGKGSDGTRSGKASFKGLSLLARLNFIRGESFTPYAVGGIGYGTGDLEASDGAAPEPSSATKSTLGHVITGAFGIETFLAQGLSLALEGRYQQYPLPLMPVSFPAPERRGDAVSARLVFRLWLGPSS